ncbi:MAG: histidine--tRNA ligase [Gammaproteobacteria bacterium RIFCSPHIGHO2_12_FULL_38_11]|nr:MAG: histidine--tRNA ligase [Gammaproteobacteria bacterium RIFCSPHIGHO2_12_FULL_38_11]
MTEKIQAIRGMHDILPSEIAYWQHIESTCRSVVSQYGYHEIRFPLLEQTQLFKRGIGDATDVVEKEMYTFEDRNGDSLSLRPEGTASCVRAGVEHGLLYNQIQRLWYMGPMFRHERPQKGRQRQFHQLGVEAFGLAGPDIDAETILLSKRILDRLKLSDDVTLEINTLGSFSQRENYKIELIKYLDAHKNQLDDDSQRRLVTNPLRILDSKNPEMKTVIENAPKLMDFVEGDAKNHFDQLCELLKAANISFRINPKLVRGLDYYCLTVFEWVTTHLGAQGTVCAGGRYDGLVALLGGKSMPAVGFAMGLERIALLLQTKEKITNASDFYVISDDSKAAFSFCEKIRNQFTDIKIEMNCDNVSFGSQFKRADKSAAKYALILGEKEIADDSVTVKNLRENVDQKTMTLEELFLFLTSEWKRKR